MNIEVIEPMGKDIIIEDFTEHVNKCLHPMVMVYNKRNKEYKSYYYARLVDFRDGLIYISNFVCVKKDIKEIRKSIPKNLEYMEKSSYDDKYVLESYIEP